MTDQATFQEIFAQMNGMDDRVNFNIATQITESRMIKCVFGNKTTLNRFKVSLYLLEAPL